MTARTLLSGPLADGQRAGITAYYTCDYHYEIYLKRAAGEYCIAVNRRIHDLEAEVFCQKINYENNITADERAYRFGYALPNHAVQEAGKGAVAGLCTEGTADMTFTGTFIGLFTTGGSAAFSYFEIKNTPAL
jgi:xylan 1,4-beta-xylosidase